MLIVKDLDFAKDLDIEAMVRIYGGIAAVRPAAAAMGIGFVAGGAWNKAKPAEFVIISIGQKTMTAR